MKPPSRSMRPRKEHKPRRIRRSIRREIGQDRILALPWTRMASRRRREIIPRVGEAQQPLRAMRTKAREGFIKALRDAHRWLDELLFDPTHTIESLAVSVAQCFDESL